MLVSYSSMAEVAEHHLHTTDQILMHTKAGLHPGLTTARCIKTNILTSQVHQRQVSVIVYHDDLHYLKKDEADSTRLSASSDKESKTVVW